MLLLNFFSTAGMDNQPVEYFFHMPHFIYLLFNIILFIILWKILKRQTKKIQDKIITIFLITMLVLKYMGDALFIYEYYNISPPLSSYPHPVLDVDTFFSFQMCGVTNILLPLVIWFDIKKLKEFVFASSILGGLAVMIYPVTVLYGDAYILTLPKIRSITVHFFLLFIPLFLINRGDYKLNPKKWKEVFIGVSILGLWATFGNFVIDKGDNNLYLMENPFLGGPIPIINSIPSGYHVIVFAMLLPFAYYFIYKIARLFEPSYKKS